jgi:hypothetical protein
MGRGNSRGEGGEAREAPTFSSTLGLRQRRATRSVMARSGEMRSVCISARRKSAASRVPATSIARLYL